MMEIFAYFGFVFLLGVTTGSFLNVLVDREPRGESPFRGRSHCDHCLHPLFWIDLIPLISFLVLRGKCRYCKKFMGFKYPFIELATGFLFVLLTSLLPSPYVNSTYMILLFFYLCIISCLIVIFFTDLFYGIIPLKVVVLGTILTIFLHLLFPALPNISFLNYFLSGLFSFLSFLAIFLITKGKGMGFGDVVYVFFMGLVLGFPKVLLGFYIAFITGAFISVLLIALKKKKMKGGTIAFGPFLVAGTIISMIWGDFFISQILPYFVK